MENILGMRQQKRLLFSFKKNINTDLENYENSSYKGNEKLELSVFLSSLHPYIL